MEKKNMFEDYINNSDKNSTTSQDSSSDESTEQNAQVDVAEQDGTEETTDPDAQVDVPELDDSDDSPTQLADQSDSDGSASSRSISSTPQPEYSGDKSTRGSDSSLPFPKSILPWSSGNTELTNQLLKAGYTSVNLIATATPGEIVSLTHLSKHQAEKLITNAKDWKEFNFETAANLLDDRSQLRRIKTGSTSLDMLLGGGIEPRSITEFYGSYTTGKTQLSIQLAVNAALPEDKGGLDGGVVYIDTEGSFRPERVVQICKALDVNPDTILNEILVGRAHNSSIQMELTNSVIELATSKPIKLLIIDSLTSNFRAEYIGKGSIMERQQKLNQHVQQLSRISDMLNIAVVITNQVMAVIDDHENSVQPVGGNILAHGSTHRIELSKSPTHPRVRYAKLVASPSLPESKGNYKITSEGIMDVLETTMRQKDKEPSA